VGAFQAGIVFRFDPPFSSGQSPSRNIIIPIADQFAWVPVSIALDPTNDGTIYVVDATNHRILKYTNYIYDPPAAIYGQPNITANQSNQGKANPTGNTLNSPTRAKVDCNGGLWVADAVNCRVLHFPAGSTTADIVLGQPDFSTADCTANVSASYLGQVFGVELDYNCSKLWALDTTNRRIVRYSLPAVSGQSAEAVLGAYNFNSPPPVNVTSGSTFAQPVDLFFDPVTGYLWVSDPLWNRVVGGQTETPQPSSTPSLSPSITPSPSPSFNPKSATCGSGIRSSWLTILL